jgi:hypothetical protein
MIHVVGVLSREARHSAWGTFAVYPVARSALGSLDLRCGVGQCRSGMRSKEHDSSSYRPCCHTATSEWQRTHPHSPLAWRRACNGRQKAVPRLEILAHVIPFNALSHATAGRARVDRDYAATIGAVFQAGVPAFHLKWRRASAVRIGDRYWARTKHEWMPGPAPRSDEPQ